MDERSDLTYTVSADFEHAPEGSYVHEEVRRAVTDILHSFPTETHVHESSPIHCNRHNIESTEMRGSKEAFTPFTDSSNTTSLMELISKLQDPAGSALAIDNLPPDTYICDLQVTYNNGSTSRFPIRRAY